jgi:hypothetical protein
MADGRDAGDAKRRTRTGGSTVLRHGHAHASRRRADTTLVRRCTGSGLRLGEGGEIVPFTPWSCATCGRREDLSIAGSIAFCRLCLDASVPEDDDDVYQDTGGGD